MEVNLRKAQFTIETFPGLVFEGYTSGESDGWASPYFAFDEARKIAEVHENTLNLPTHYDESGDKFIFEMPDETEEYPAILIEEKKLYPIGNCEWIWEENR